jgi:hypothetical protein
MNQKVLKTSWVMWVSNRYCNFFFPSGKRSLTLCVLRDNLLQVWMHWRDDRPLELLDPSLRDSYSRDEVLRCIQIGLLCVQEDPANRPTMASILLTLNNGSVTLPSPQELAFFPRTDQSTSEATPWSVNDPLLNYNLDSPNKASTTFCLWNINSRRTVRSSMLLKSSTSNVYLECYVPI